ncbi:MAG TPA: tyrosine recombinase XerC [Candidatus Methylomirabilis sp.]|nr:tyrosine recombinase XerC [Candidatus Methylomirabilis sp.]
MQKRAHQLLNQFLRHLGDERRLSPLTLIHYGRDLAQCVRYCDDAGVNDWGKLTIAEVRGWVAAMHRHGLSGKSIQRALSALRSFYRYLMREQAVARNPASGVTAPKSARRLPKTLTTDQAARLVTFDARDPLAWRDRALLELLYSSGLRLSELVNLDLAELDLAGGLVRVTGKGRKVRDVPVGAKAREALREWLARRGQFAAPEEPAVFLARNGRRLGPRAVQARLRHWAVRQGIEVPVHPHMLRHSFASHVLESSGDLRAVQEMLGHANISTTQIYTHLDFQHLANVYDKAHPRARRKNSP